MADLNDLKTAGGKPSAADLEVEYRKIMGPPKVEILHTPVESNNSRNARLQLAATKQQIESNEAIAHEGKMQGVLDKDATLLRHIETMKVGVGSNRIATGAVLVSFLALVLTAYSNWGSWERSSDLEKRVEKLERIVRTGSVE